METPLTLGATLSTAPSLSEPHIQERWPFLPLLCDQMPQGPSPAPHWAQGPRAPWLPCPPQCLRAGPCCHPCFQLPGLTSEDRQLFGEQQDRSCYLQAGVSHLQRSWACQPVKSGDQRELASSLLLSLPSLRSLMTQAVARSLLPETLFLQEALPKQFSPQALFWASQSRPQTVHP